MNLISCIFIWAWFEIYLCVVNKFHFVHSVFCMIWCSCTNIVKSEPTVLDTVAEHLLVERWAASTASKSLRHRGNSCYMSSACIEWLSPQQWRLWITNSIRGDPTLDSPSVSDRVNLCPYSSQDFAHMVSSLKLLLLESVERWKPWENFASCMCDLYTKKYSCFECREDIKTRKYSYAFRVYNDIIWLRKINISIQSAVIVV